MGSASSAPVSGPTKLEDKYYPEWIKNPENIKDLSGRVALITGGQEQQVAALQIADIELRHGSLAICSRRFIGLLDLLLLVVFPVLSNETWKADMQKEIQKSNESRPNRKLQT